MRLSSIIRSHNPLLESVVSIWEFIGEDKKRELSWPQKLSDDMIKTPQFQKWLKSIGIVGPIGKPMSGYVGRAYPVGDNYIIKFTTDSKEAQSAAILKGHDSPHAADIYGVHRVLSWDEPTLKSGRASLYAIAMQRLNTGVGGRMRAAGNAVYAYMDDFEGFIEDPDSMLRVVMADYVDPKLRDDEGMKIAVRKVIGALYDVQKRTGVLSQDPHGGNVAFKGREPAFFDFGRSKADLDHPKAAGAKVPGLPN